jgi:hypothetical protein
MLYGNADDQMKFLPYPGGNLLSVVTEGIKISIGRLKPEEAVTYRVPQEIKNYASEQLFTIFLNSIEIGERLAADKNLQNKYFTLFIRYLKYIFQQLLPK